MKPFARKFQVRSCKLAASPISIIKRFLNKSCPCHSQLDFHEKPSHFGVNSPGVTPSSTLHQNMFLRNNPYTRHPSKMHLSTRVGPRFPLGYPTLKPSKGNPPPVDKQLHLPRWTNGRYVYRVIWSSPAWFFRFHPPKKNQGGARP